MSQKIEMLRDSELARLSRAGSVHAFDEILKRYERRVYRFICSKVANPEDAEDITQTIFIKAFNNIGRFKDRYSFATWIFCIARRECISHYRKNNKIQLEPFETDIADNFTPAMSLAVRESSDKLWRIAKKKLTESQFEALWMIYKEDMSVKDAARVLNRTQTAVKVMIHRARLRLVEALSDDDAINLESKEDWRFNNELLTM